MGTIYRGWISGEKEDEKTLLEMGIKLGPRNEEKQEWIECEVTSEAMEKLNLFWGPFVWGLDPVKIE